MITFSPACVFVKLIAAREPFSVRMIKEIGLLRDSASLATLALLRKGWTVTNNGGWTHHGIHFYGYNIPHLNTRQVIDILRDLKFVDGRQVPHPRFALFKIFVSQYNLNAAGIEAFDALPDVIKQKARACAHTALRLIADVRREQRRYPREMRSRKQERAAESKSTKRKRRKQRA